MSHFTLAQVTHILPYYLNEAVHVGNTRLTCLLNSLTGNRGVRRSQSLTPSQAPTAAVRNKLYASEEDKAE